MGRIAGRFQPDLVYGFSRIAGRFGRIRCTDSTGLHILLASLADVALIAAAVAFWGGFASQLFVLLYPVVFAFALVFPPRFTAALTVVAAVLYVGAVAAFDLGWAADIQLVKVLLVRLLTLAAVGGLGTYYWRIQRSRRRAALSAALGR